MEEIWKDVPGYEGLYFATPDGHVIHSKNHRVLTNRNGFVSLRKEGKNTEFKLDQIIYTIFVDAAWDGFHKIHHIDCDDMNCAASNLTCSSTVKDLPGEIWKPFRDKYEVSSLGRVKYVVDDVLHEPSRTNENCAWTINVDSQVFRIAELVADIFLNRKPEQCVSFIDGNSSNYCLDNLTLDIIPPAELGEVWRFVKGYENKYMISSFGRVYSVPRKESRNNRFITVGDRLLKLSEDQDGYYKVVLVNNTDTWDIAVHRLVALNFIENPYAEIYTCVNHIDGNKHNNHVENLEWCTNQYNVDHAMNTGLRDNAGLNNPKAITTIVVDEDNVKHRFNSMNQAAYFLNVNPESLRLYLHGRQLSCSGLNQKFQVYTTTKDSHEGAIQEPTVRYINKYFKDRY